MPLKSQKGKSSEMNLPLIKNDITTIFYGHDTCVLLQKSAIGLIAKKYIIWNSSDLI